MGHYLTKLTQGSVVVRSSGSRCVQHSHDTRHIRESDANVARNKGCYFWTPLYAIAN
jgi:hypothetical protein